MRRKSPSLTYSYKAALEAERHVGEASARVDEQRRRIHSLRAEGRDTKTAEKLLADMNVTLATMIEHRDWISARQEKDG